VEMPGIGTPKREGRDFDKDKDEGGSSNETDAMKRRAGGQVSTDSAMRSMTRS